MPPLLIYPANIRYITFLASTCKGTQLLRPVPNIYTGVQTEEEKQRQKIEHATYRRLFMDIEREQVKENIRRQEHRKKIMK